MAIETTDGMKNVNPKPEVRRFYNNAGEPYTNLAEVLTQVDPDIRYRGQEFFLQSGEIYFFLDGTQDNQLVLKGTEPAIAIEEFMIILDQNRNSSGNTVIMNGWFELLQENDSYLEINQTLLPVGFLGGQVLNCGSDNSPTSTMGEIGFFFQDGGAGFFDGQTTQWNKSLGFKIRCTLLDLIGVDYRYSFAFGMCEGISSDHSQPGNSCIFYDETNVNWQVNHKGTIYDTGVLAESNEWIDLRIDIVAGGAVIYTIGTVRIVTGAGIGGYVFGVRARPLQSPDLSTEVRPIAIDTFTLYRY